MGASGLYRHQTVAPTLWHFGVGSPRLVAPTFVAEEPPDSVLDERILGVAGESLSGAAAAAREPLNASITGTSSATIVVRSVRRRVSEGNVDTLDGHLGEDFLAGRSGALEACRGR
jgi:hypothetical protein